MKFMSVFRFCLLLLISSLAIITRLASAQLGYGNAYGAGGGNNLLNGLGLNNFGLDGLGFNGLGLAAGGAGQHQATGNNLNNGLGYGLGEFFSVPHCWTTDGTLIDND
jgi:hypothetical protein